MRRASHPLPTHYTKEIDKRTGSPMAVRVDTVADPDEIAGELPEHWEDGFWTWEPKGDPGGAWVELEDRQRDRLWRQIKDNRAAEREANIKVAIRGRQLTFQADAASVDEMRLQLEAARVDSEWPGLDWTTAGNAQVYLDRADLEALLRAIATRRREIHARSQEARTRIFDKGKPLARRIDDLAAGNPLG